MYYDTEKSQYVHILNENGYILFKMPIPGGAQFKCLLCLDWDWTDGVDDHAMKCPTWYHTTGVMNMEYGFSEEWILPSQYNTVIYLYGTSGNMTVANDGFIYIKWKVGPQTDAESWSKNLELKIYPKIQIAWSQGDINPFEN